MIRICLLSVLILWGCNGKNPVTQNRHAPDSVNVTEMPAGSTPPSGMSTDSLAPERKIYSNQRFRDVTVTKTGDGEFMVQGEGQIFEASFSWVVEDGHNELQKGFQMTDAGAPEWGKFKFTVTVTKERENSTLILILFESSPRDGSRQHELPIVLY